MIDYILDLVFGVICMVFSLLLFVGLITSKPHNFIEMLAFGGISIYISTFLVFGMKAFVNVFYNLRGENDGR